jgi:hypothetical protein
MNHKLQCPKLQTQWYPCNHAIMQPCNIISTLLFFPSSQLPSLPPGRRRQKKNVIISIALTFIFISYSWAGDRNSEIPGKLITTGNIPSLGTRRSIYFYYTGSEIGSGYHLPLARRLLNRLLSKPVQINGSVYLSFF